MGFVSSSLKETQAEFEWDITWDGRDGSTPLTAQSAFWNGTIQVVLGPADASGAQAVLGLDLVVSHKQGPHLADTNPGAAITFRMDPVQIFVDWGSADIQRGAQTANHGTSGTTHKDHYTLATHRLFGQDTVTIKLRANHSDAAQPIATGTVPAKPVVTPPGAPTTPPLAPPREGKGKGFTFVEKTDFDNGYDWLSGALRFGEVDVATVKEMVDHIVENLGEDECIKEIVIIGHGCPGNISVGNGDAGSVRGKEISVNDPAAWRSELLRLRCKFCEDSTVYLRGCNVGADKEGAQLLQMLNETFQCAGKIQAPTGLCNPVRTMGEDQEVTRGGTSAPTSIPSPEEKKKAENNAGSKVAVFAGKEKANLVFFDPIDIASARYLPRIAGTEFDVDLVGSELAKSAPGALVGTLRSALNASAYLEAGNAGLSINGYLQLMLSVDGEQIELPAWTVYGGGRYVGPILNETAILFELDGVLQAALGDFVTECAYG